MGGGSVELWPRHADVAGTDGQSGLVEVLEHGNAEFAGQTAQITETGERQFPVAGEVCAQFRDQIGQGFAVHIVIRRDLDGTAAVDQVLQKIFRLRTGAATGSDSGADGRRVCTQLGENRQAGPL